MNQSSRSCTVAGLINWVMGLSLTARYPSCVPVSLYSHSPLFFVSVWINVSSVVELVAFFLLWASWSPCSLQRSHGPLPKLLVQYFRQIVTGDVHLATDLEYFNSATIWCKDGTKSFPRERLNDNFCDCADGTDEPGELPLLDKQKSLCQGFGIWYFVLMSTGLLFAQFLSVLQPKDCLNYWDCWVELSSWS